jgi:hypothetical protein
MKRCGLLVPVVVKMSCGVSEMGVMHVCVVVKQLCSIGSFCQL